jgi:hypothetical protein
MKLVVQNKAGHRWRAERWQSNHHAAQHDSTIA